MTDQRIRIELGATAWTTRVWLDGHEVSSHIQRMTIVTDAAGASRLTHVTLEMVAPDRSCLLRYEGVLTLNGAPVAVPLPVPAGEGS